MTDPNGFWRTAVATALITSTLGALLSGAVVARAPHVHSAAHATAQRCCTPRVSQDAARGRLLFSEILALLRLCVSGRTHCSQKSSGSSENGSSVLTAESSCMRTGRSSTTSPFERTERESSL